MRQTFLVALMFAVRIVLHFSGRNFLAMLLSETQLRWAQDSLMKNGFFWKFVAKPLFDKSSGLCNFHFREFPSWNCSYLVSSLNHRLRSSKNLSHPNPRSQRINAPILSFIDFILNFTLNQSSARCKIPFQCAMFVLMWERHSAGHSGASKRAFKSRIPDIQLFHSHLK